MLKSHFQPCKSFSSHSKLKTNAQISESVITAWIDLKMQFQFDKILWPLSIISSLILSEGQWQQRFCHVQVGTTHARIRMQIKALCKLEFLLLSTVANRICSTRCLRLFQILVFPYQCAIEPALFLDNFIFQWGAPILGSLRSEFEGGARTPFPSSGW